MSPSGEHASDFGRRTRDRRVAWKIGELNIADRRNRAVAVAPRRLGRDMHSTDQFVSEQTLTFDEIASAAGLRTPPVMNHGGRVFCGSRRASLARLADS